MDTQMWFLKWMSHIVMISACEWDILFQYSYDNLPADILKRQQCYWNG